jgi:hypothetical protein
MSEQGADQKTNDTTATTKPAPKSPAKKHKTEPEVTIAPSGPGGPDISIE